MLTRLCTSWQTARKSRWMDAFLPEWMRFLKGVVRGDLVTIHGDLVTIHGNLRAEEVPTEVERAEPRIASRLITSAEWRSCGLPSKAAAAEDGQLLISLQPPHPCLQLPELLP